MSKVDISLTIGGPQGGGIETSSNLVSRAFAYAGYNVFSVREYHSNIKGRHSYTHMRIKEERPRSLRYPLDVLVALDSDTIFEHIEDVGENTKIIYDSSFEGAELSRARMITKDTAARIRRTLEGSNAPLTVTGAVQYMKNKGGIPIPVPFNDLITAVVKEGTPSRYFNTLGSAITLAIAGVDREFAEKAIKIIFASKEKVIPLNIDVVGAAYDFVTEKKFNGDKLKNRESKQRLLITGNDGSAIGKLMAGLRFQTYYPITPASDESTILEQHQNIKWLSNEHSKLAKGGIVVVQSEDELSAVTMAIGAALTGVRSSTATSGPGFSLMAEAISFAGMDEVPLVITLYMRGGPSTGLPTRNGQSDLLFALNTGHGEFPRIVLSSGDVEECIYDAIRALNYAQRYQVPVIHLIDKNLANSLDMVPDIDTKKVGVKNGLRVENMEDFKRYSLDTEDGVSPMGVFGKNIFWMTGDEHDEKGHVTEDTEIRDQMMVKRFKKIETAQSEIPLEDKAVLYGEDNAELTFVTWGSQKGPILDVIDDLAEEGVKANLLYLKMFEPFPTEFVKNVLSKAKKIVNVESNMLGQAAQVIKLHTGIDIADNILKYNGRHMTEDEILKAAKKLIGKDEHMVVLQDGA